MHSVYAEKEKGLTQQGGVHSVQDEKEEGLTQ